MPPYHVATGDQIAKALGLNYAFFCEFEELRSPLRTPELQVCGILGKVERSCMRHSQGDVLLFTSLCFCTSRVEECMATPFSPSLISLVWAWCVTGEVLESMRGA